MKAPNVVDSSNNSMRDEGSKEKKLVEEKRREREKRHWRERKNRG